MWPVLAALLHCELWPVLADLPVHCEEADVAPYSWTIFVRESMESETCGYHFPNTAAETLLNTEAEVKRGYKKLATVELETGRTTVELETRRTVFL